MIDSILKTIAPHYCYGCARIGNCLCVNCKNHIIDEPFSLCLSCLRPISDSRGLCKGCKRSYSMSWCVGEYDGALKDCIQALKFVRNKEAAKDLAALLDDTIPELPLGTIVTFVPTISSHRRQRGYDHAKLIAKRFARTRKLRFNKVLNRLDNSRQLGASAKQRWSNARTAYAGYKVEQATYLLIDDVMTSGATLECASKVLKDAGANAVWVACLARQTLD